MGRISKKRAAATAASAAALATKQAKTDHTRAKQRRKKEFVDLLGYLDGHIDALKNVRGRVRSVDENKLTVLVFRRELQLAIKELENADDHYCTDLTLNKVYNRVADTLCMDRKEVKRLKEAFCGDDDKAGTTASVEPVKNNANRGKGSANAKPHGKLTKEVRLKLIGYIDKKHAAGKKVNRKELRNWLRKKQSVEISSSALGRTMVCLGLSYKPSKPTARNNNACRVDQISPHVPNLFAMLQLSWEFYMYVHM